MGNDEKLGCAVIGAIIAVIALAVMLSYGGIFVLWTFAAAGVSLWGWVKLFTDDEMGWLIPAVLALILAVVFAFFIESGTLRTIFLVPLLIVCVPVLICILIAELAH